MPEGLFRIKKFMQWLPQFATANGSFFHIWPWLSMDLGGAWSGPRGEKVQSDCQPLSLRSWDLPSLSSFQYLLSFYTGK